ncbi:MAG: DUF2851 family protein [Bacteroides sp.]
MEVLLQYLWKHKIFPLKPLQTDSGLSIEVIDPGLWNTNSGPDFFNAKLKIQGTVWVGNIEIHEHSSDWFRHGHDKNKAYDSVILHVIGQSDCSVYRTTGEPIPQFVLICPPELKDHYEQLCHIRSYPACQSVVARLSPFFIHSWLSALEAERLDHKMKDIERWLRYCNQNWEDTFFITLARNFGFGLNGEAFECWAKKIPFRAVDKHRDDLFQIEAFFFGQAGLLNDTNGDPYFTDLQKEFFYLQHKFELVSPMEKNVWRFLRLRPSNFPFIRLAQLAYLYHHGEGLFSKLMEAEDLNEIRNLLTIRTSSYWEEHYVFGKYSRREAKKLGDRTIDLICINTIIPFLHAFGQHKGEERLSDRAQHFLEQLRAENNVITRKWNKVGIKVDSAADSQALIELEREYCEKKRCLDCRFGFEFMHGKVITHRP